MSKELEKARELVRMLEEKERKNKVVLSSLPPGETFKIGEHDFIVLNQDEDCTEVVSKGFMAENKVFDNGTRDYAKSSLKKLIEEEFEPCTCKVRPITFNEARKYNNLLANEDLGDWWWTCTPWSTAERNWKYAIAVVSSSGYIYYNFCYYNLGVRPFCILKSNIFISKE